MKKLALLITSLAAALSGTQAASIFTDSFSYPDGGIVANSGGIWANISGTAGTMRSSNSTLIVSSSLTEDIGHRLPSVYATNGPTTALYSSFTIKCIALPNAFGNYFAHFSGTNFFSGLAGFRARIYAALTNSAAGTLATGANFHLYIANSGVGGITNGGQWTTALLTNVTYTIVTRYELATGTSTLWVNPSSEADPSVTDPVPLDYDFGPSGVVTNGPNNISHYGFRQSNSGGANGTMLIDDLKIGTLFTDVAGANTSPSISPIANHSTPANTPTAPIPFVVGDAESLAASLTVSNASSNPALVPTGNIVFNNGDGTNRTVTITPASGQGSANITVFVSDGINVSSTTFKLTVGAPSISAIANQITYSNTPLTGISFTVSDSEGDTLTVGSSSSNPTLIPAGNVVISGTGASRSVTLTPLADQTGVSIITLSVYDAFNTNTTSFVLSVSPKLGVLFFDDFNYNGFTLGTALQGADLGGVTNSPWGNSSGTNYDLLLVNGTAQLSKERSEDLGAGLASGPFAGNSGVVLYASFSITFSNPPTQGGDYFAHFKDTITGTTFRDKLFASSSNAAPGYFRLGLANVANNFSAQVPLDLTTNQTYFVVTRYNSGTGESVLWVNPANESSTRAVAQDVVTTASIGAFGLRQSDGIGISYLDNLLIGTSFSDVAAIVVTPIPLNIQSSGSSVILTWSDASFNLQSSTNVTGPYTTISGAATGFTTNTLNSQLYFRLLRP